jgi:hypothetical protein
MVPYSLLLPRILIPRRSVARLLFVHNLWISRTIAQRGRHSSPSCQVPLEPGKGLPVCLAERLCGQRRRRSRLNRFRFVLSPLSESWSRFRRVEEAGLARLIGHVLS